MFNQKACGEIIFDAEIKFFHDSAEDFGALSGSVPEGSVREFMVVYSEIFFP